MTAPAAGPPLAGVRVLEIAGLGPAPFCGMLLADFGADVVVVERPDGAGLGGLVPAEARLTNRGKRRVAVDLKSPRGREAVLGLAARADVLVEGFRPGVMERLRLGPAEVLARRPGLVYARLTGWGQEGPRAGTAGHDITYLAVAGMLDLLGRAGGPPTPPANLLGDYAAGSLFALAGILAALLVAGRTGQGQVVDAAIVDGLGVLRTPLEGLRRGGAWPGPRGTNLLDTGAPFYDVYQTRDGRWVAVGALEDRFFASLADALGLDPRWHRDRWDPAHWPALREALAAALRTRTLAEWDERFRGSDACVAPVLTPAEAAADPHIRARGPAHGGGDGPPPAPRFGGTPCRPPAPPPAGVVPVEEVAAGWEAGGPGS
jgi:alpha-methylacyl-CoA racemase